MKKTIFKYIAGSLIAGIGFFLLTALLFFGISIIRNFNLSIDEYKVFTIQENKLQVENKLRKKTFKLSIPRYSFEKTIKREASCLANNNSLVCFLDGIRYAFKIEEFNINKEVLINNKTKIEHELEKIHKKDYAAFIMALINDNDIKRWFMSSLLVGIGLFTVVSFLAGAMLPRKYELDENQKNSKLINEALEETKNKAFSFNVALLGSFFILSLIYLLSTEYYNNKNHIAKGLVLFFKKENVQKKFYPHIEIKKDGFTLNHVVSFKSGALIDKIPETLTNVEILGVERISIQTDGKSIFNNKFECNYKNSKTLKCLYEKKTYIIKIPKEDIYINNINLQNGLDAYWLKENDPQLFKKLSFQNPSEDLKASYMGSAFLFVIVLLRIMAYLFDTKVNKRKKELIEEFKEKE